MQQAQINISFYIVRNRERVGNVLDNLYLKD